MRLTAKEIEELKKSKPFKLWRLAEPVHATPMKAYTVRGQVYTVLSVEAVSGGDIMRRFGKSEYAGLIDEFGEDWSGLWLVVLVAGDRTDKPRMMHWTGRGGDARAYGNRLLGKKKVMQDMEAVGDEELDKYAAAAREQSEAKRRARRRERTTKKMGYPLR